MPVQVKVAKCCLTEEAARVMNDAATVARRRNHNQTTSLHAVSALLTPPSSLLREACVHTRRNPYNARLQLRALELCVGVSLDRLPSSSPNLTAVGEEEGEEEVPPVSNSLMAAIRRAQAAQKRSPDNNQLQQIHAHHQVVVKVDMKFFVLSILDDPVVSRVFGEAGFRSLDVKLWIMSPEVYPIAEKLSPVLQSERKRLVDAFMPEDIDENSKIIGNLLSKKQNTVTRRNPLLLGVCSLAALEGFLKLITEKRPGVLPQPQLQLQVISLDRPIFIYTVHGGSEDQLELKFKEAERFLEEYGSSEPGVVVNFGELRAFVDFKVSIQATNVVVSKLTRLFKMKKGNIRFIGTCLYYETFLKFQEMFPDLEKEWDLHLLPVSTKSGSMNSFVPLTGFFSWSIDDSGDNSRQFPATCYLCLEKYQQEVQDLLKTQPSSSNMHEEFMNLHSRINGEESEESREVLNSNILKLQNKWMEICNCQHRQNSVTESAKRAIPTPNQPIIIVRRVRKDSRAQNPLLPPACDVTTDLALGTMYKSDYRGRNSLVSNSRDCSQNVQQVHSCSADDFSNLKAIRRLLAEQVTYQEDAICGISEAIWRVQNGYGKTRFPKTRRDIWLNFVGHDRVGMRKMASALAEAVFGNKDSFIAVDFSSTDGFCHSNSIFRFQNSDDMKFFLRKNDTDYIVCEVRKKPCSVIFLENVDEADNLLRSNLSQAIKTGKFSDSHGKEISISNTIFITTISDSNVSNQKHVKFSEELILRARSWQIKIILQDGSDPEHSYLTEIQNLEPWKKRKWIQCNETIESSGRGTKSLRRSLDLNLPTAGEEDTEEELNLEDDHFEKSTQSWSEEFCSQVDENVTFKPFDFDELSEKLVKEIELQFRRVFGSGIYLEIDYQVMVQVLAAAWLSGRTTAVEEWIEKVLGRSFRDVWEIYRLGDRSRVRIAVVDGVLIDEFALDLCLPGQVNV